jgi:hypothetical protein
MATQDGEPVLPNAVMTPKAASFDLDRGDPPMNQDTAAWRAPCSVTAGQTLDAIGLDLSRRFCQMPEAWPRRHGGRLNAVKRRTGPGWVVVAVVAIGLATATPSWSGDNSGVVAPSLQGNGTVPGYHLGVGMLDSELNGVDAPGARALAQAAGAAGPAEAAPAEPEAAEQSASELNRKLTNPVSTIWSLTNQFNNFKLANGHWNNNWNFQPVLPLSLTKDWNLITRPVIPLYNIVPHETAPGQFERTAGLGDMVLLELLSPANSGNWILGAGPTFIFPTATSKSTGQGKWQAGPGVVVGYLTKKFILGVFPQQWFSIGGDPDRPATSQLNLQPIAAVFFGDGWNVGYSGNILANWKASSGDVWTVPIGLGVGKVVKLGRLPVKINLSLQYMPVRPRNTGQEWDVQVQITPVIPKLIKGILFR